MPTAAATVNPMVAKMEISMFTAPYFSSEASYSACWLHPLKAGMYDAA